MGDLLAIVPSSETVTVGNTAIAVPGVSVAGIADLMRRFPKIRDLFSGSEVAISVETLLEIGPDIVAAIIAAGCGSPGNAEQEAVAANLPVMTQTRFLTAILKVTFPDGLGKAGALLTELASAAGLSLEDSPTPSNPSSQPATRTPSRTPPGKSQSSPSSPAAVSALN